ncbi:MAG: hypothetical protein F4Z90_12575 [Acidimicrobiaceae bacterium]|nr:hypothetical protein [Acidimicrobiaceae bacterium]
MNRQPGPPRRPRQGKIILPEKPRWVATHMLGARDDLRRVVSNLSYHSLGIETAGDGADRRLVEIMDQIEAQAKILDELITEGEAGQ